MTSPIKKGDIVWLDPEAGGANPSGRALWLPGQERYQWVVTEIQPWSAKMNKLKYPWARIKRLDNGLPVFYKLDVPMTPIRWIDTRWLRKDEFLSAVKQARKQTQTKKENKNNAKT